MENEIKGSLKEAKWKWEEVEMIGSVIEILQTESVESSTELMNV